MLAAPNLYSISPCKSSLCSSSSSMPCIFLRPIPTTNRRSRPLTVVSFHSPSIGEFEDPKNNEISSGQPPKQSQPTPSPPLPNSPPWLKWTLGSIVWLSLPSWKKLQTVQDVVTKVDTAVEMVEDAAEATEKMASSIAEVLPDGDGRKKVFLELEQATEQVLKDIKAIDTLVDEVKEQVEGWTEKLQKDGQDDQEKIAKKEKAKL